ncbi:fungal protein [Schizosaccharomyces cryophilus OY26]|uniref:Fungal protein n=1 Tax=Schizosaccharomyces cryophilus (strain OY26 / ATCC MYA-4695 / CBS 11777 / NBRC 106824 / NRRL Y48691) TaxID=653667 RepID=S9VV49_SCHCR|nr:uncharacterized protein SPOG_00088 [Schizosaccharomyces cryophilus OY26]EPY51663.1 fungal protein [Schizosaccharomyces cryophilus OY26]
MDETVAKLLKELEGSSKPSSTSKEVSNDTNSSQTFNSELDPSFNNQKASQELALVENIRSYPAALRYVFSLQVKNPEKLRKVKKLKTMQERQERDWFMERQRLIHHHQSKNKLKNLLTPLSTSLGHASSLERHSSTSNKNSLSEHDRELEEVLSEFDKKVVLLTERMYSDQRKALSELRIPLFLIPSSEPLTEEQSNLMRLLQDLFSE